MKYYHTYLFLMYLVSINVYAKPQYVFQSVDPIANFAWDENHAEAREPNVNKMEKINDIPNMGIDAINIENKVRHQTGDTKRTTYGDKEIPNNMLD